MKIGLIVSALILVLVVIVTVMALNPPADRPTRMSMGENLQMMRLDESAGTLVKPSNAGSDATSIYDRAFDFFRDNRSALMRNPPREDLVVEAADMFIEAAQAGSIRNNWLDEKVELTPGFAASDGLEPMGGLPIAIVTHAWEISDDTRKEYDRAIEECKAVYVFGYRAYAKNKLFEPRYKGLIVMENAADQLRKHYETLEQPDEAAKWAAVRDDTSKMWSSMDDLWNYLHESPPRIGDLLNVAQYHEDPAFRIGATLRLGIAKLQPKHRGNRKAINNLLTQYKSSSEPLLAEAAAAALEYRP